MHTTVYQNADTVQFYFEKRHFYFLQHFFSAVRSKGGYNDHPTVRQAAAAVRILASNAFLLRGFSKHTNVEEESRQVSCPEMPSLRERLNLDDTLGTLAEEPTTEASLTFTDPEETDDQAVLSDMEGLTERDTLAYVTGAMLHRLGCPQCTAKMVSDVPLRSGSFIRQMTFTPSCHMLEPTDATLHAFALRLKPIIDFFEKNFFCKYVLKTTIQLYRLNYIDLKACCQEHADALLRFFARMLLRVFCKDKNCGLKGAKSNSRKLAKLVL